MQGALPLYVVATVPSDSAHRAPLGRSAVAQLGTAVQAQPPPPGHPGAPGLLFWARLRRGPLVTAPRTHVRVVDTVPWRGSGRSLAFVMTVLEAETISAAFPAFDTPQGLAAKWFLAPDDGSGKRSLRMGSTDASCDALAAQPADGGSSTPLPALYLSLVHAVRPEYDRAVRNVALNPCRADDYADTRA